MIKFLICFITLLCVFPFSAEAGERQKNHYAEALISQKLLLDIRYFCESPGEEGLQCRQPVTELPPSLAGLLKKRPLGGVILFAENFVSIEQTVKLTDALQRASLNSRHQTPLLITTDQEAGAVTRLPSQWATSFAGNMAIAALPPEKREKTAYSVGKAIGTELHALGVNVNHSPVLDVNSDPANPVIHVRAFSDDPDLVSTLGSAMARGIAAAGVAPNAKHFPGHGHTSIDSHLGLPTVHSDLKTVLKYDLAPFTHLIKQDLLPVIMTAHIQYPALDDTLITAPNGKKVHLPATLSRKIITDLLRGRLKYQGVVASDAINMKAISNLFSPVQATRMAFNAGVDLVLMPITIRSSADFEKLDQYISALAADYPKHRKEWKRSVNRINNLKHDLNIHGWAAKPVETKILQAKTAIGSKLHQNLSEELASGALSFVHGQADFLPLTTDNYQRVSLIFSKPDLAETLSHALKEELGGQAPEIQAHSLNELSNQRIDEIIEQSDLVIFGHSSPKTTLAEIGGMEDWQSLDVPTTTIHSILQNMVSIANKKQTSSMYISFGFPYELSDHLNQATYRIAAYNDKVIRGNDDIHRSATISALAAALSGKTVMTGRVPIDLSTPED